MAVKCFTKALTLRHLCCRPNVCVRDFSKFSDAVREREFPKLGTYERGTSVHDASAFLSLLHKDTLTKIKKWPRAAVTTVQDDGMPDNIQIPHRGIKLGKWHYCCDTNAENEKVLIRYHGGNVQILSDPLPEGIDLSDIVSNVSQSHAAAVFNSDNFNTILLLDLKIGRAVVEIACGYQAEWDGGTQLFYTTIDSTLRPHSVFVLDVTNIGPHAELVYRSNDDAGVVTLARTKDNSHVTINTNTKRHSQVGLVRTGERTVNNVITLDQGQQCFVEHRNNTLLAVSSDPVNLVLKTCPLSDPLSECHYPNIEQFTTLYKGGVIHDMEVFAAGIVLYTSTNMLYSLVLINDQGEVQTIHFPQHVSQVVPGANPSYNQPQLNLVIKSYVKPSKEASVSFNNFKLSRHRLQDNGDYKMTRLRTPGGVPLTVINQSPVEPAPYTVQPAPYTLFQCYGCYGQMADYSYEALPHTLLSEGACVVVCHTRGGGEMGRSWYHAGAGDSKEVAVEDTLACIEHCYTLGIAHPPTSFLQAYSAGCVVAAAAYHSSGTTLKGLILQMPFLDLQTAMEDSSLALTKEEVEEWGDYTSLCPVTNNKMSHPNVCLTVGGADLRSPPWHAANYLSTMNNYNTIWVNFLQDEDHNVESDAEFQYQFVMSTCWSVRGWVKRAWNVRRERSKKPESKTNQFNF